MRFQIWRIRRRARVLSRWTDLAITARMEGVAVGQFRHGREVKG